MNQGQVVQEDDDYVPSEEGNTHPPNLLEIIEYAKYLGI